MVLYLNTRIIFSSQTQNLGTQEAEGTKTPISHWLWAYPKSMKSAKWKVCVFAKLNSYKLNTFMFNTDVLKCKDIFWFMCKHWIISFIGFDISPYAFSFQYFRALLCLFINVLVFSFSQNMMNFWNVLFQSYR